MALLADLRSAVEQAVSVGAGSLREQGTLLRADFENLVRPNIDDVLVRIADIGDDYTAGNIGPQQARDELQIQLGRVQTLIIAVAELALLAVQIIVNAVLDAIKGVVNAATTRFSGIALL